MGVITAVTVVGSGLLAGVYTAFTVMVVPALRRRPAAEAAAVMVEVNRVAERGPFLVLFGGVAVAASALGVSAVGRGSVAEGAVALAALAGTVVTVAANVPLNRRLERGGAEAWHGYQRSWTRWNTVRAIASGAAVVIAAVARV